MRFSMYLARIMYKDVTTAHKVGMTILNLEVEDRGRLVKRKKVYALNRCRTFVPACIVSSFTATVKKTPHLAEFRRILSSAEKLC